MDESMIPLVVPQGNPVVGPLRQKPLREKKIRSAIIVIVTEGNATGREPRAQKGFVWHLGEKRLGCARSGDQEAAEKYAKADSERDRALDSFGH